MQQQCFSRSEDPAVLARGFDIVSVFLHLFVTAPACSFLTEEQTKSRSKALGGCLYLAICIVFHLICGLNRYKSLDAFIEEAIDRLVSYDYTRPKSNENPRFSDESVFFYGLTKEGPERAVVMPLAQAQWIASTSILAGNLGLSLLFSFLLISVTVRFCRHRQTSSKGSFPGCTFLGIAIK